MFLTFQEQMRIRLHQDSKWRLLSFIRIILKKTSLLYTGYLAEYYEPHMRSLLSKCTIHINGLPDGYSESIMEDYDVFINAIQTYKHVVTNYLSSKMELWTGIFMKLLFDIVSGLLTLEFAKSRGAIHCRCILWCRGENNTKLPLILKELALQIHYGLEIVNKHIAITYVAETHDSAFSLRPNKINKVKFREPKRKLFCELNNDVVGTSFWKKYSNN